MATSFMLSKVGPGFAEGVSAFYPAIKSDRQLLGSLSGKPVFLSRRQVGVVKSVDVYEAAGSALLKTEIHDPEAQHMLGVGCLSCFELDSKTGTLDLRDRPTAAGDVFSFVRADGAELQKSFHHAPTEFDRDVEAEQDRRLQDSIAKTFHPITVNSNSQVGFGGGIPTTPLAMRSLLKGGRSVFKSHNARATSNSQFGPGLRANRNAENLAYSSAQDRQRHSDPETEPWTPASTSGTGTPASADWPNGLPAAGASQSRTQLPNRNSRT